MPKYLITLTDDNALRLESMLGSAVRIGPAWDDIFHGVLVAGVDGVTDEEAASILRDRKHPLYHHGGPESVEANLIRLAARTGTLGPTKSDAVAEALRTGRRHVLVHDEAHEIMTGRVHGFCTANAKRGTGTGICDRPLDSYGQCDRASDHL